MDNSFYATLTRQSGLLREMQVVANNIANLSTSGFRAEGVVFAEHVRSLGPGKKACRWLMPRVGRFTTRKVR